MTGSEGEQQILLQIFNDVYYTLPQYATEFKAIWAKWRYDILRNIMPLLSLLISGLNWDLLDEEACSGNQKY